MRDSLTYIATKLVSRRCEPLATGHLIGYGHASDVLGVQGSDLSRPFRLRHIEDQIWTVCSIAATVWNVLTFPRAI